MGERGSHVSVWGIDMLMPLRCIADSPMFPNTHTAHHHRRHSPKPVANKHRRKEVSEARSVNTRTERVHAVNPTTHARFKHLVNMEYKSFISMFRRFDLDATGIVTLDHCEEVLLRARTGIPEDQ